MSLSLIPPNIIEYFVAEGSGIYDVTSIVNAKLKEGFIPYGELHIWADGFFYQVMIKQGMPNSELLGAIAKMAKVQSVTGDSGAGAVNITELLTRRR